eukprot:2567300-Alexandrium_andersonii.AAC.1
MSGQHLDYRARALLRRRCSLSAWRATRASNCPGHGRWLGRPTLARGLLREAHRRARWRCTAAALS